MCQHHTKPVTRPPVDLVVVGLQQRLFVGHRVSGDRSKSKKVQQVQVQALWQSRGESLFRELHGIMERGMKVFAVLAWLILAAHGFTMHQPLQWKNSRLMMMATGGYDYDLIIVGCGVGGHGAALHARSNGLKTAVLTGKDIGGTCVNRGCVPSKALLAAAGRIRDMKDAHHLKSFGIAVGDVSYDRAGVAAHAQQLADRVKGNLEQSLKAQGVDIIESFGQVTSKPHEVKVEATGKIITAKNIILAPGSIPFVPRGVQVDEQTVYTSDGGLKLSFVPQVYFFAL